MFFNRRKKKKKLTETETKWNLLWDKYADGSLESNYFMLCDYHAGVNGGGHYCFFDNKSENLSDYVQALKLLLPSDFFAELNKAYEAYVNNCDVEKVCDSADDYFYKNQQVIDNLLQSYADTLE